MGNVTVGTMVFVNADLTPPVATPAARINMSNAGLAIMAKHMLAYSDQIKLQAEEGLQQIENTKLGQSKLKILSGWTAATWTDNAVRTQQLKDWGVITDADLKTTKLSWEVDLPNRPYVSKERSTTDQPSLVGPYSATDNSFIRAGYDGNDNWVRTSDSPGIDLIIIDAVGVYTVVHPRVEKTLGKVTDDDITRWSSALIKGLDDTTKSSQNKQVFMQDLMANYNKFLNLFTNLLERFDRERSDVLARF